MINKAILTKSLKFFFAAAVILIVSLFFFFGAFSLSEGYNILSPYADTEFAKDYSPEKFKQVKVEMNMKEIYKLSGEPMNIGYDTTRAIIIHTYTQDGYLRRNPARRFSLCGDLAWHGSSVEYNSDSIAVNVYSGWYYD